MGWPSHRIMSIFDHAYSKHLGPDPITEPQGSLALYQLGLDAGLFTGRDGSASYGLNVEAAGLKTSGMQLPREAGAPEIVQGFELGVNEGALQAFVGENGGALGVQANVLSGSYTAATRGTDIDESWRAGLSLGAGAAVRGHWADEDGDGLPEYGLGFDIECLSGDVTSEDPLFTLLNYVSLGAIGAGQGVFDQVRSGSEDRRANWTQAAIHAPGDLTDAVAGVEGTSGTRGGVRAFEQMGAGEQVMAALLNDGMRPERRREILAETGQAAWSLFGGQF